MTIIHTPPSLTPTPDPVLAILWGYVPAKPTLATVPATTHRRG